MEKKTAKICEHKKVLRHECKRHTTCRVASSHYVALSPDGEYPIQSCPGWEQGGYTGKENRLANVAMCQWKR